MPALTDLNSRLNSDPKWRAIYDTNLPQCEIVARNICLIHVCGNKRKAFVDLISTAPHEIPTSGKAFRYCSDETRKAEDDLGLGRCVYFYAGRAHFKFGKIALAFEPNCEYVHTGSVTPFDTGGLANGSIASNLPDNDTATLRSFAQNSLFKLVDWRSSFSQFLAAYFSPIVEYILGKPFMNDPEELLFTNADWRARAFEVRFHESLKILEASFWCASKGQKQLLERAAKAGPPIGSSPNALQDFITNIPAISASGTPFYCEELENEVWRRAVA